MTLTIATLVSAKVGDVCLGGARRRDHCRLRQIASRSGQPWDLLEPNQPWKPQQGSYKSHQSPPELLPVSNAQLHHHSTAFKHNHHHHRMSPRGVDQEDDSRLSTSQTLTVKVISTGRAGDLVNDGIRTPLIIYVRETILHSR